MELSRKRRTRILVDGDPAVGQRMCAEIESLCKVNLIKGPHEVLVMNKVRESAKNSLFYLGEALLTECKVSLTVKDGNDDDTNESGIGIGLILGGERDRAYELAVIDAAFGLDEALPGHAERIEILINEEKRLEDVREKDRERLAATRVDFSTMITDEDPKGVAK